MTETTDWNSGQGAYPSDRNEWTLTMVGLTTDHRVVRHLSSRPTSDEIRSLCDDEMGDTEAEVTVSWYLEYPDGGYADGRITLKPTGGAA
jgi:hypothetical protein